MHDMLHDDSAEGSAIIANERYGILKKTDEGSASIMQDFEDVEKWK